VLELTDQAFAAVQPLLPGDSGRGKPWRDHRQVLGGILWKLHTGRPWRDVPERFGPWRTCYGRLRRWQADGTWARLWAVLDSGHSSGDGSGDDRWGQAMQASKALLAAVPVAAASAGLMAAPPPRPPQHLAGDRWLPPHQGGQQPARLGGGDPDQVRAGWPWRLWQFCVISCPLCGDQPRGHGPPRGTRAPPAPG
jgi:transposase